MVARVLAHYCELVGLHLLSLVRREERFAARMFSTEEAMIPAAGDGVRTGSGESAYTILFPYSGI